MKNINITLFAIACSVTTLTQAQIAGEGLQRVVVSYPLSTEQVTTQSVHRHSNEQCLTLDSGTAWCVPIPAKSSKVSAIHQAALQGSPLTSMAITVPAELSIPQAISLLSQAGFYTAVEPDVAISVQSWNETDPDEEYFDEQYYFQPNSVENPTGSSILAQWSMLKNPEKLVDVYVLDSGFHLADDMDYAPGFNFENSQEFSKPGPGFLELDYVQEGQNCFNNHGLGVASVIGAKINNSIGVTGTTGHVVINPIRVMHCGSGFMSDVAVALNWLSGQTVAGFPDFTGKPGVVNMSLGGKVGESACPTYLQEAINNATQKGFTVVVSAGNQGEDSTQYIPGKCANVINVGSATPKGKHADISSFSNYGAALDVLAVGEEVLGLRSENRIGYWEGTSLASPLVAGMILNASKDFDLTPAEWQLLMPISSVERWTVGAECETKGCAKGVLDAGLLYTNAQKLVNGELDSLTLSLNAVPACRQQWMIDNLPKGQALCEQAMINMRSMTDLAQGDYIEVHALLAGQTIGDRTGLVGQFDTHVITLDKMVFDNRTAFVLKCNSDGQCQLPVQLNTIKLKDTPEACKE